MSDIFKIISALDEIVKRLFWGSWILIISIEFILCRWTELFNGGAKIGVIISGLSLSVIASIIFYFFLVHLKEFEAKKKINPWITKAAIGIIGQSYGLYSAISKLSGIKLSGNHPTEQEIKNICEKINPYGSSYVENGNIRRTYLTWVEFLNLSKGSSQQCIDRLILLMPYLPASLIELTFKIKDCIYFVSVTNINAETIRIRNVNIDCIAKEMFEYFMLTKELTEYLKKNYPETRSAFKDSLQD